MQPDQDVVVLVPRRAREIARAVVARGVPGRSAARRRSVRETSISAVRPSSSGPSPRSGGLRRTSSTGSRAGRRNSGADLAGREPRPALLSDLDPALVGRADPREIRRRLSRVRQGSARQLDDRLRLRTPGGRPRSSGSLTSKRLWGAVAKATRLDDAGPGGSVARAHRDAQGASRCAELTAFDAVRFRGPGHRAHGGSRPGGALALRDVRVRAAESRTSPNLPTEEVFTSPDWRRAEGTVRSTYPLVTAGTKVSGSRDSASREGRSSTCRADVGAEIIRAQLATDDQAPYLGEFALVDGIVARQADRASSSATPSSTRTRRVTSRSDRAFRTRSVVAASHEELLEAGINVSGSTSTS